MRELTQMELEVVEGGNPSLVVPIVIGVVVLAGIATAAYAVANECNVTLEIGAEGLTLDVDCSGNQGCPGG